MKKCAAWLILAIGMVQIPVAEAALASHHAYTCERASLPSIRVLVAHDIPNATLEVQGSYNLQDPHDGTNLGRRLHGKQRCIEPLYIGLKWGEEFPGRYQVQVQPSSPESAVIVNGVTYYGNVTFYDVAGTLSVVHELPIEEYVMSQLANQSGELPDEALAALAIAARSQAYYLSQHPRNAYWDVDAMTAGYQGDEVVAEAYDVQRAVKGTRYMVLTQPSAGTDGINVLSTKWSADANISGAGQRVLATQVASTMAASGADAARILAQAFPGVSIRRIQQK